MQKRISSQSSSGSQSELVITGAAVCCLILGESWRSYLRWTTSTEPPHTSTQVLYFMEEDKKMNFKIMRGRKARVLQCTQSVYWWPQSSESFTRALNHSCGASTRVSQHSPQCIPVNANYFQPLFSKHQEFLVLPQRSSSVWVKFIYLEDSFWNQLVGIYKWSCFM